MSAQIERINRSFMVVLPKRPGAVSVDSFRPICLQNCSVKILSKTSTCWWQKEIGNWIDLKHTGFLQGRSISESFICAAEIVQTWYKRKILTIVLKLDFAKAFDTVNWLGLDRILAARGFNSRWRRWICGCILNSSRSAVLVNGVLGPWISCKRGLTD